LKPVSGFNENERSFFSEIVFIMQTYFFVYVGISLQFGSLSIYGIGLALILLIIASRPFVIKLFTRKNYEPQEVAIMSVMTPKGLIPAILASLPLQMGLASGTIIMDLGYSVVLFSILLCSGLVIFLGMKNGKNSKEGHDIPVAVDGDIDEQVPDKVQAEVIVESDEQQVAEQPAE
jgi:NhaP-type Na+/H+ or K+/H+ antiporter